MSAFPHRAVRHAGQRLASVPSLLQVSRAEGSRPHSTAQTPSSSSAPTDLSASASSQSRPAPAEPTTHYRITLRRSAIGLPERSSQVLESLGLKKRLSSVYMRQEPTAAGKILKVKELVAVQNVRRATEQEAHLVRKHWTDRMRTGLRLSSLIERDDVVDNAVQDALPVAEEDDVWIDENGFVVDAGRVGKKAPRGYRVVGNALDGTGEQITV
ncbi:hypothetical protein OC834_003629 [Tilletia horrida]|nr:hypothetical protein OC834_003629 [Tilletia horrida]